MSYKEKDNAALDILIGMIILTSLSSCGSFGQSFLSGMGGYGGYSGGSGYSSNGNLNYLLDPNYAIQQTNAQLEAEYQQMRQVNPSLTREQFMQTKANETLIKLQSKPHQAVAALGHGSSRKVCSSCKGDGKCIGCHGSGYRTDNMFGNGTDYGHKCGVCGGNGTCSVCKGAGYR